MSIEQVHGLRATKMLLNTRFSALNANAKFRKGLDAVPFVPFPFTLNKNRKLLETFNKNLQQNNRWRFLQHLNQNGFQTSRYSEGVNEYEPARVRRSNSVSNMSVTIGQRRPGSNRFRRSSSYTSLVSEELYNRKQNRGQNRMLTNHITFQRKSNPNRSTKLDFGNRIQNRQTYQQHGYVVNENKGRRTNGMFRGTANGGPQGNTRAPVTKEELDKELDQYMSLTKSALDKQLDQFLRHERIEF